MQRPRRRLLSLNKSGRTGAPRFLGTESSRQCICVHNKVYCAPESKLRAVRMRSTISLSEFADMLGVSKRLIYKLIDRNEAPPLIRVGRRVLIRREAAERWIIDRERHVPAR